MSYQVICLLSSAFAKSHETELKMLQCFRSDATIKEKFSKKVFFPMIFYVLDTPQTYKIEKNIIFLIDLVSW